MCRVGAQFLRLLFAVRRRIVWDRLQPALADRIAKREETDRIAYEIFDAEALALEKKTERLRELRLARECADGSKDRLT